MPWEQRAGLPAARATVLRSSGCQGAQREPLALGERLQVPMVHTMRGKEHVEGDNPYDIGMTGLIGFSSGYSARSNEGIPAAWPGDSRRSSGL
jgi:pyruvate dehydrogenase (quinone)